MGDIRKLFKSFQHANEDIRGFFNIEQLEKLEYHTSTLLFEKTFNRSYEKKYDNYMYNARNVMFNLLANQYDLSAVFDERFSFPLAPSQITRKPNRKGEVIIHANGNNSYLLSKTLKEHFDVFLQHLNKSKFGLDLSYSGTEDYRVFYVNYIDILVFSLTFILQDGRVFPEDSSERKKFPRFKVENSCSISSYKIAFESILNLYSEIMEQCLSYEDFAFYMIQIYKINKGFRFFNLNNILVTKRLLLSDELLEFIYERFKLTYKETLELKETLEKEIFKDNDFISFCLKCEFSNPMIIFKTLFEAILDRYALMYANKNSGTYEELPWNLPFYDTGKITKELSLEDLIDFSKKKTIQYINKLADEIHKDVTSQRREPEIDSIGSFDIEFWNKNYFSGKDLLGKYIKVDFDSNKEKDDYLDFLIGLVIENLDKSFYK